MREWLEAMAPTSLEDTASDTAQPEAANEGGPGVVAAAPAGGFVSGKITRREDALKAIAAAADFFLEHEPLSPLGATLREVDRRARMSLHNLLNELIPDESARRDFYWRSGIKPPMDEEDQNSDDY